MPDLHADMLPCPNPWCDNSVPVAVRSGGLKGRTDTFHILCERCGIKGPEQTSRTAAIASWNTRRDVESGEATDECWHDGTQPAPEGQPVLAVYRTWNRPNGRLMKHVVWWLEGDWRVYPFTSNRGHVDRWRPLAAT